MSEAAHCPKCGAESKQWKHAAGQMFHCDSWLPTDGELDQSKECRIVELTAENERLKAAVQKWQSAATALECCEAYEELKKVACGNDKDCDDCGTALHTAKEVP